MTAFSSLDCPRRDEVDEDEDALERLERRKSFLGWIVGAFLAMPRDTVCLVAVREAEGLGAMDREGRGLCVAGRKRSLCRIAQGRTVPLRAPLAFFGNYVTEIAKFQMANFENLILENC